MTSSIIADAYVKALKNQLYSALDALAYKEAELAQAKLDLSLANQKFDEIMAKDIAKDAPDQGAVPGDSWTER